MHVLVLGGGVVGVTNAWYLCQAGHQVTVIDRQPGPALETSFANAGQLSFGYTSPWAAPGIPLKAVKWLFEEHAPLAIKPTADLAQYRWLLSMLRNCTAARYAVNKARMVRPPAVANPGCPPPPPWMHFAASRMSLPAFLPLATRSAEYTSMS